MPCRNNWRAFCWTARLRKTLRIISGIQIGKTSAKDNNRTLVLRMDNFYKSRDIRLAFGIPFDNLGFHELMLAVKDLVESDRSHCILAVTAEYVIRAGNSPLLSFDFCDLFIPCDTKLLEMAQTLGLELTMPARHEEFAEQIVRICAHNGHSLFNISANPISLEMMDDPETLLLPDNLFTNFILEDGRLEKQDRTSILHSVSEHRPNVILVFAGFEILQDLAPEIMEHSRGSLVVCVPVIKDLSLTGYISRKFAINALLGEEEKALTLCREQKADDRPPSSLRFLGSNSKSKIIVSGILDTRMLPGLRRMESKVLKRRTDVEIDFNKALDISYKGLEGLLTIARKLDVTGKKVILINPNEIISQKFHEAGVSAYFKNLPGIPEFEEE